MKKRALALILALLAVLTLSACGGKKSPYAGTWQLVGAEDEGLLAEPSVLGLSGALVLKDNGTGTLSLNGGDTAIKSWNVKDSAVTVKTAEDEFEGTLENGILALGFDGGTCLYFAVEGTDISSLELLDAQGFRDAYNALVESGDAMPAD